MRFYLHHESGDLDPEAYFEFETNVTDCQTLADTTTDELKNGPLRLPSESNIPRVTWHNPRALEALIGLAKMETAKRARMLAGYPVTRQQCDQYAREEQAAPYSPSAGIPEETWLKSRWAECQAFTAREERVVQALQAWIAFAEQFFQEHQRASLSHETGAGAIIERIENNIVYWKGNKASLCYYLNASTLWNHRSLEDRVRWAKALFRIDGKPATLNPGNISAASERSAGRSTAVLSSAGMVSKIDWALRWYSIVPNRTE